MTDEPSSAWFREELVLSVENVDESTTVEAKHVDDGSGTISSEGVSQSSVPDAELKDFANNARVITKVQAIFRGRMARAHIQKAHDMYIKYLEYESKNLAAETERVAAIHIQAMFRGVYVRQMFRQYMGAVGPTAQSVILQLKADKLVLEHSLRASNNEVSSLSTEISVLREKLWSLESDKEQLTALLSANIARTETVISSLESEKRSLEQSIAKVDFLSSELSDCKERVRALESDNLQLATSLSLGDELVCNLKLELRNANADIEALSLTIAEAEQTELLSELESQLKLSDDKVASLTAEKEKLHETLTHVSGNLASVTAALNTSNKLAGVLEGLKLGYNHDDQQDGYWSEAESVLNSLLVERENTFGSTHHQTTVVLDLLGQVYDEQNKLKEAEDVYKKSLGVRNETLGPSHKYTVLSVMNLGGVLRKQQQPGKAAMCYYRAHLDCSNVYGVNHHRTRFALGNGEMCLHETNKSIPQTPEDAEMYLRANLFAPSEIAANRLFLHAASCECCECSFTVVNREHHCRLCYRAVCQSCSPTMQLVPKLDSKDKVRLCIVCSGALKISPHIEDVSSMELMSAVQQPISNAQPTGKITEKKVNVGSTSKKPVPAAVKTPSKKEPPSKSSKSKSPAKSSKARY